MAEETTEETAAPTVVMASQLAQQMDVRTAIENLISCGRRALLDGPTGDLFRVSCQVARAYASVTLPQQAEMTEDEVTAAVKQAHDTAVANQKNGRARRGPAPAKKPPARKGTTKGAT